MTKQEQELLDDIRALVEQAIELCDSDKTPKICAFRSTPKGFVALRDDILNRVANQGLTIAQAMQDVEREYSHKD